MEHERNPLSLENMSRRAQMATVFGTLAGKQEPTIFHLFGLDPQAYDADVTARDVVPEVHSVPACVTDELLEKYQQTLLGLFKEYYAGQAHPVFSAALEWLRRLEALQPKAVTTAQRVKLMTLRCRYHQLIAALARELHKGGYVTFHTELAVALAEEVQTLPNAELGEEGWLTLSNELVAAALLWRADASYEIDDYVQAQDDIDCALDLLPEIASKNLKGHIAAVAGLIHAQTATSAVERALVLSYFKLAEQMHCRGEQIPDALDEHGLVVDIGLLYLRKAMALLAPPMRGTTAEKVLDLLEAAQRSMSSLCIRQQVTLAVFEAWAHFYEGDYQQALEAALEALERSRQVQSSPNKDRIAELYEHLLETDERAHPHFAYLGWKLRTWDAGMDGSYEGAL